MKFFQVNKIRIQYIIKNWKLGFHLIFRTKRNVIGDNIKQDIVTFNTRRNRMLINKLKRDKIQAMKDKKVDVRSILSVVIAAAQSIAKNDGNRENPTDEEVIVIIKKQIKANKETLDLIPDRPNEAVKLKCEIFSLAVYLPKQLSEEELKIIIQKQINSLDQMSMRAIGQIMRFLKENHAGLYDGKLASTICKELLTGE